RAARRRAGTIWRGRASRLPRRARPRGRRRHPEPGPVETGAAGTRAAGARAEALGSARARARGRQPAPAMTAGRFPLLRLRRAGPLLDLPWELPLDAWPASLRFRVLPVGPSRHLVRFLVVEDDLFALKEEPIEVGRREYDVLTHLERVGLPAVTP